MSQRKVKMVRKQLRKFKVGEVRAALDGLKAIAGLPLKQRLWFAWRIVITRRFD